MRRNPSLRTRLIFFSVLFVSFTTTIGILGIIIAGTINYKINYMYDNNLVAIKFLGYANNELIYHNKALYNRVISSDKEEFAQIEKGMKENEERMNEYFNEYLKTILIEKEKEILNKFRSEWPNYIQSVNKILALSHVRNNREAMALLNNEGKNAFQDIDDILLQLVKLNDYEGKKAYMESSKLFYEFLTIFIVLLVLSIISSFFISYKFTRAIIKQVGGEPEEISKLANSISEGDYSTNYNYSNDEKKASGILESMIIMAKKLKEDDENIKEKNLDLEMKNAELERFAYTVSHDLKSPLITIKSFMGFVKKDLKAGNQERVEHDMERIMIATDTMHLLLDDLLSLSRIGRVINMSSSFSMDEVASEVVDLLQASVKEKNINIKIDKQMPIITGDRTRIREVYQNLIENSIKYMGEQKEPFIELGFLQKNNDEIVFFVKDNGMGIEHAYHQKIFHLFDKLDQSTEGSGIGLSLVKRIIELYDGKIWVESEGNNKGSTFYFTIGNKYLERK